MPITILVETDGGISEFVLKPIDKTKKDKKVKRIAVDSNGSECRRVHVTHDGNILHPGCTADLYEDADGNAVEHGDLLQTDAEGRLLRALPATTGRPQRPIGPIPVEEVMLCVVTRAYALSPVSMARDLCDSLHSGDIYRVSFRPRAAVIDYPAFLLANDTGIYLLRCEPILTEYIRLDQPVILDEADYDDDTWDDWEMSHAGITGTGGDEEW
ncbi:MAG: hypothetical protein ACYC27_16580 [Armatimonadota bacterium]